MIARARLTVAADDLGTRVREARALAPQRWGAVRRTADGWFDATQQSIGDGIFAGDWHATRVVAHEGARVIVRGLTATPLRRGASGTATLIRAEAGATVLHFPGLVIPQAGSDHTASLRLEAAEGARILAAAVIAPGRSGMGERGAFERLRLRTTAWVAGRLALAEDGELRPETIAADGVAIFDGRGASVSVIALGDWEPAQVEWWDGFRDFASIFCGAGVLRCGGVSFRALCETAGDALELIDVIERRVRTSEALCHSRESSQPRNVQ